MFGIVDDSLFLLIGSMHYASLGVVNTISVIIHLLGDAILYQASRAYSQNFDASRSIIESALETWPTSPRKFKRPSQ